MISKHTFISLLFLITILFLLNVENLSAKERKEKSTNRSKSGSCSLVKKQKSQLKRIRKFRRIIIRKSEKLFKTKSNEGTLILILLGLGLIFFSIYSLFALSTALAIALAFIFTAFLVLFVIFLVKFARVIGEFFNKLRGCFGCFRPFG